MHQGLQDERRVKSAVPRNRDVMSAGPLVDDASSREYTVTTLFLLALLATVTALLYQISSARIL